MSIEAILTESSIQRLTHDYSFSVFDCGHDDLNEFLLCDSIPHLSELYAVTYLLKYKNKIVAFYSVSNDKISWKEIKEPDLKEKIRSCIPESKSNYGNAPAVKIGRLGVDKSFSRMGIGTFLLDGIKHSFTYNNKTGCRFITVDARNTIDAIKFYENNGFLHLLKNRTEKKTVPMYYDLFSYKKAVEGY